MRALISLSLFVAMLSVGVLALAKTDDGSQTRIPLEECDCWFPNTGAYGVIRNGPDDQPTCIVATNCWLPL
jgi:hypothetical protein